MKSILLVKKLLGLVEMTSGLVNASFSLPEWQALKMIFFEPCKQSVDDLTLAQFLKHVVTPQKRQVFHCKYSKTPHWRFQKKAKS